MPDAPLSPPALHRAAIAYLSAHPDALQVQPAVPPTNTHRSIHWTIAGMAAGQAADAFSTYAALQRPDAREANPVYGDHPSLGRLLATKAATIGPIGVLLDKLYDRHPKVALSIAISVGALGGGLAVHNSRQGRK